MPIFRAFSPSILFGGRVLLDLGAGNNEVAHDHVVLSLQNSGELGLLMRISAAKETCLSQAGAVQGNFGLKHEADLKLFGYQAKFILLPEILMMGQPLYKRSAL